MDFRNSIINKTSIGLSEMDSVAFLKRMDSKFLVNTNYLPRLIDALHGYRVLHVEGNAIQEYLTHYFEYTNFKCYYDHFRGKPRRYKIRKRSYLSTGASFFEIKKKKGDGLTSKYRIPIDNMDDFLNAQEQSFLTKYIEKNPQWPIGKMSSSFKRVTFVNTDIKMRLTIDFDLSYHFNNQLFECKNLGIVETKTEKPVNSLPIGVLFSQLGIRNTSFSKYCYGMINLYGSDIKTNVFKELNLKVNRL